MKLHRPFAFCACVGFVLLVSFTAIAAQEPAYQGTPLSVWMERIRQARTEQQSTQASNAIHHIGTNAVPFLLQRVRLNNRRQDPVWTESLRIALACKVLGSRAEPIITELTNRLWSTDEQEASIAAYTLLNTGALALWPLMKFYSAPEAFYTRFSPPWPFPFSGADIDVMLQDNPREMLPIMIQIYEGGSPKVRLNAEEFLRRALSKAELSFPVLKPSLQSPEPFIRSQILGYLRRRGTNATAALPEVKKLLTDPDPTVRSEATNALAAIEPQK